MKSFKKIAAGILSLALLSSLATYGVAADSDTTTGDSNNNTIGNSSDDIVPGESDDDNDIVPGESDDDNDIVPGESDDDNDIENPFVSATGVTGDITGDGVFNGLDLILAKKIILGLVVATDEQAEVGDVDNDGTFNGQDLVLMKQVILGLTEFDEA